MEFLNFHHLRYFWTVARKGGVRRAAEELGVSQPSISAQLKLLEEALGEKLFRRGGRNLVLTEAGQVVLSYADEIFSAGRELMNAVKQRPGSRALRLTVGMTDAVSKLLAFEILRPAFDFPPQTQVICRQAEIGPLIHQLQAHRLDLVLADEPASSTLKARIFNHRMGRSGTTFLRGARRGGKAAPQFSALAARVTSPAAERKHGNADRTRDLVRRDKASSLVS
jgi:LysR family transcriptional activator of nhaA